MCAILLVLVGISIYWIFMYDTWYPNPVNDIHVPESDDSGHENMGIRTE